MKSYFDKKRTALLTAYGRYLKQNYPCCRYSNACVNMRVFFPRQSRYRSLNLNAFFGDQEYFAWQVRNEEDSPRYYEYQVSIFPRGTLVYKLNWIPASQFPATERQIDTLTDMLILHHSYCDYPCQAPLDRLLSRRRASDIITALLANKHVALVLDFEWHDTADEQG